MSENIIVMNEQNFEGEISNGVTLVDFWAEWCGPCRMLTPIIEQIALEYMNKAKIAKVNVDDCNAIAAKYGIMSIPTVIIFKNGEQVEKSIGLVPKDTLCEMLDKHL